MTKYAGFSARVFARTALAVAFLRASAHAQTFPTTTTIEPAPALPSIEPTTQLATEPTTQAIPEPTTLPAAVTTTMATEPATQPVAAATTRPAPSEIVGQPSEQLQGVLVTSDLDLRRVEIAPPLGAVTYTIGANQIQNVPGGQDASFQQVLLRAPGVVPDSFGQLHVRGEHADLTYRINGVLLPEPLNGFGQEVDTRIIQSVTLIDGSLPAQFGLRTAAVIDISTKSGDSLKSNELSLYGGSYDTFVPSLQLGGIQGKLDYFVVVSHRQDGNGIENPTGSLRPIHDDTTQDKLFAYLAYHIDQTSRLTLLVNASYADFQIPDTPDQPQMFTLAGHPTASSADIDEKQNEQNYYTVVAYQQSIDDLDLQISAFTSYGQIDFMPDDVGDLIFQGLASHVFNSFLTSGVQGDASYKINEQHTLRFGLLSDYTLAKQNTNSLVFPVDTATGDQSSDVPLDIRDNSGVNAVDSSLYVQDEWQLTPKFTVNYGVRYDHFDSSFDHEGQLSPRANTVYKLDSATTLHAGYARYFAPPTPQYVGPRTLEKFAGTTNAPETFQDDPLKAEKSNYFDVGASHQMTKPWFVNVDGFYKQSDDLLDLGQFGDAVILSPFNYKRGTVYGAEVSSTFTEGGFSAFSNFSWVSTYAHDITSSQYQFDLDELDYIRDHNIHLDHESEYTVSSGLSYAWPHDRVYIDSLFGSGLRRGFANLQHEGCYYPINLGYEHVFHPNGMGGNVVRLRFDVVNVFDDVYQLRQGGGLGVNASQYGQRRSFYVGLAYDF